MSVTSWKFPGTTANVDRDGKTGWGNTDYAKTDDANSATVTPTKNSSYSDWLRLTNFGFTASDIPSNSIINGIEVIFNKTGNTPDSNYDSAIYLRKTSGQNGSNYASAELWAYNTFVDKTYGGSSDLWGGTWGVSDINSTDFGIDVSVVAAANPGVTSSINFVKIRIHYTVPTSSIKSILGLDRSKIKSFNGLAIDKIKQVNNLT